MKLRTDPVLWLREGVPVGADGTGGAVESIVNQTAVDVLRRLPVSADRAATAMTAFLL